MLLFYYFIKFSIGIRLCWAVCESAPDCARFVQKAPFFFFLCQLEIIKQVRLKLKLNKSYKWDWDRERPCTDQCGPLGSEESQPQPTHLLREITMGHGLLLHFMWVSLMSFISTLIEYVAKACGLDPTCVFLLSLDFDIARFIFLNHNCLLASTSKNCSSFEASLHCVCSF